MSNVTLENGSAFVVDSEIKMVILKQATQIALALKECSEELREEALMLMKQIADPSVDEDDRFSSAMVLSEILFPDVDPHGWPGLDLREAEDFAKQQSESAVAELGAMDSEEETFAERLKDLMDQNGVSQESLARQIGVGQPAISMMLQRSCRPQKRTVVRIAEALNVAPEELWPSWKPK